MSFVYQKTFNSLRFSYFLCKMGDNYNILVEQRSAVSSYKVIYSKCFRLCTPSSLCHNYSILLLQHQNGQKQYIVDRSQLSPHLSYAHTHTKKPTKSSLFLCVLGLYWSISFLPSLLRRYTVLFDFHTLKYTFLPVFCYNSLSSHSLHF